MSKSACRPLARIVRRPFAARAAGAVALLAAVLAAACSSPTAPTERGKATVMRPGRAASHNDVTQRGDSVPADTVGPHTGPVTPWW